MSSMENTAIQRLLDSIDLSSIRIRNCLGHRAIGDGEFGMSQEEQHLGRKDVHCHNYFEVNYLLEGNIEIVADERAKIINAYDVVIYGPQCKHGSQVRKPLDSIVVWFEADYDVQLSPCFAAIPDTTGSMRWLFEQVYQEYAGIRNRDDQILSQLLATIVLYTKRLSHNVQTNSMQDLLRTATKYIESNYYMPLNIPQMAEMINVSKSYFHKIFRAHTGLTPLQYLNNTRISNAKVMLEFSTLSVQEISDVVGFEDTRYFSRLFKQLTDFAPREWRKQARNPAQS